jgi:hypothetical protein
MNHICWRSHEKHDAENFEKIVCEPIHEMCMISWNFWFELKEGADIVESE